MLLSVGCRRFSIFRSFTLRAREGGIRDLSLAVWLSYLLSSARSGVVSLVYDGYDGSIACELRYLRPSASPPYHVTHRGQSIAKEPKESKGKKRDGENRKGFTMSQMT